MTFTNSEKSRQKGAPVELYDFITGVGTNSTYRYTSHSDDLVVDGHTYVAIPVDRGSIAQTGSLDKTTLNVTVSERSELARLFIAYPPSQEVMVILRQVHVTDLSSPAVVWNGRLISVSRVNNTMQLSCEPVTTAMRRRGLRRNYQHGCPHVLYGSACRVSEALSTVDATIIAVTGTRVTLAAGWNAKDVSRYAGGMVKWSAPGQDNEIRTIRTISGDVLTLNGPLRNIGVGGVVQVSLGCQRTLDDCTNTHNNAPSFGGMPWIPKKNPIGFLNQFY